MGEFQKCLKRVLQWEGGNDDDPRDTGGRTSRGILQREYDRYRSGHNLPPGDVFRASQDEIVDIYRRNYWDRIGGDDLPDGVDLCVFDAAVNSGVAQAAKWAQRAAGGIAVDGDFGPATRAALRASVDRASLIEDISSRRLAMLQGLAGWKHFGRGWSRRVSDIRKTALAWSAGSVAAPPVSVSPAPVNRPTEVKPPAVDDTVVNGTTVGSALAAAIAWLADKAGLIGDAARDAVDHLQPVAGYLPAVQTMCGALLVVAAATGIYVSWTRRRHAARLDGRATARVER